MMRRDDLTLYERLMRWCESGEACPPLLRRELVAAFSAYVEGARVRMHLEKAFGIAPRPRHTMSSIHRRLTKEDPGIFRMVDAYRRRGAPLTRAEGRGAYALAAARLGLKSGAVSVRYPKLLREIEWSTETISRLGRLRHRSVAMRLPQDWVAQWGRTCEANPELAGRLLHWCDSGLPCPPPLRMQLTEAFSSYFEGRVPRLSSGLGSATSKHLEAPFGLRRKRGRGRVAGDRLEEVVGLVRQLREAGASLTRAGAFVTAGEKMHLSPSTVGRYWTLRARVSRPEG